MCLHDCLIQSVHCYSVLCCTVDSDVCWLHLINEGVVMNRTSATFEWQPSGPFVNYKSTAFRCLKDDMKTKEECKTKRTQVVITRSAWIN